MLKFAKAQNITQKKLSEMILDAWTAFGGQIWSGDYKEMRAFIIDWPVKRDLVKIEVKWGRGEYMALWLGTGKIEEENFSKYFRERKKLLEFYLNDMKFRIVL